MNNQNKQTKNTNGRTRRPRGQSPKIQHDKEIANALRLMAGGQSLPKASRSLRNFDNPQFSRPKKGVMRGMSYGDGFDKISAPEKAVVEIREFDELVPTAILGSSGFAITGFPINPGQASVFPRLSKLAVLYERYRFKKLEFYFQHDVSPFNAQGAAGLIIVSGLYDASSATPTLKSQVEVTQPHVICMPNENSLCRFNPQRLHPQGLPLFVRPGTLPGGSDIKTYDAGNVFVTTQGMAGPAEIGELHVRGVIEFIGDILDSSAISAPANNQFAFVQSSTGEALVTTVSQNLLLAGTQTGSLGLVNTAGSIILPAGNYLLDASAQFSFVGLGTQCLFSLLKGAVQIPITLPRNTFTSGSITACALAQSVFIVSDGTAASALTFSCQATFTTLTCSCSGSLRITAV